MGLHTCAGLSVAPSSVWCPNKHSAEEVNRLPLNRTSVGVIDHNYLLEASFQTSPYRKRGADIGDGLVFSDDYLLIE